MGEPRRGAAECRHHSCWTFASVQSSKSHKMIRTLSFLLLGAGVYHGVFAIDSVQESPRQSVVSSRTSTRGTSASSRSSSSSRRGSSDPFPGCDGELNDGCTGSATSRAAKARQEIKNVDLNGNWNNVREAVVSACGLKVQRSTSHCFNDYNHVDCCTMASNTAQRTNEESKVVGMHPTNFLGSHIVDGSVSWANVGDSGSWCTCQLSAPRDVCHQQFGAEPAFKLIWCDGTDLAIAVTDAGELLNYGRPRGGSIPVYGAESARRNNWRIIDTSGDAEYKRRIVAACSKAKAASP